MTTETSVISAVADPVNWSKFDESCTKMKKIGLREEGARPTFLLLATKLGQGNIFRSVCQEFCPRGAMHGGGHAWKGGMRDRWGARMVGGMHGSGACMAGGIHGGGGMHGRGACVTGGGTCMAGGMRSRGRAWHTVNERTIRILLECILVLCRSALLYFL